MLQTSHASAGGALAAPARRPADEIAGDLRDRLAVLLNVTEVFRLGDAGADPDLQSAIRMIERQVKYLGRLADEISPV